ncbi:MAG: CooT family nickel-binding protein [Pseudomonadota bacterium]
MCEANAYWMEKGTERLIMESVDILRPDNDGTWNLINIFGDQKTIRGRVLEMNLVNHRIVFEPFLK